MQLSNRLTMALHILACVNTFKNQKMTSDFLAESINTNPVVIRRVLSLLKKGGIINVSRGTGGITLIRPIDEITYYDVFRAVECLNDDQLFNRHDHPNPECPVGRHINGVLDNHLNRIQQAMESEMKAITIKDLCDAINGRLEEEEHGA